MKIKSLLVASLMCAALASLSQNEVDALRYGLQSYPGSARAQGMGGAFGAVGADVSSFFTNPAGIGAFRRGGVELGFYLSDQNSISSYNGNQANGSKTKFGMPQLGYYWTNTDERSRWKNISFGFANSKLQNFNQQIEIDGRDEQQWTYARQLAGGANGIASADLPNYDAFYGSLAWDGYVIDPDTSTLMPNQYVPANLTTTDMMTQHKSIKRSGNMNETVFGGGGCLDERLYIGISVGFLRARYAEYGVYSETYNSPQKVAGFSFADSLVANGAGLNAKFGVLFQATKWLKIGGAIHTKTKLNFNETFNTSIHSTMVDGTAYSAYSPINSNNYFVQVPGKYLLNAAFTLGDFGIISADYQYTNFGSLKLMPINIDSSYNFHSENAVINQIYRGVHQVRLGMEVRVAELWRFRAGAGYQQNPFVTGVSTSTPIISYSGGIGWRKNDLYMDLAVVSIAKSEYYYMYSPELVHRAQIATNNTTILLSVGLRL